MAIINGIGRLPRLRIAFRAWWITLNLWAVAPYLIVLIVLLLATYAVWGSRGGSYLLSNLFAAALGIVVGASWRSFKRRSTRPGDLVQVDEYFSFGGVRFPLKILDGPSVYQPHELVLQVSGDLNLFDFLTKAHSHMVARMDSYRGDRVLFDGICYVLAAPPMVRRTWENPRERPTLLAEFSRTSYFIRVLCRGAMAPDLARHIAEDWPSEVPALPDLRRAAVNLADDFSPFLHTGAGINVCLVAYDRAGRPWTLVQRRGSGIAEDTGTWATSIHESFSADDVTVDGRIDPYLTATRGAREELGISLTKIEFFVVATDEGSLPGQRPSRTGGFELIGWAETSLAAERLGDTRFRGRDKFEAAETLAMELSVESLVKLLLVAHPSMWFPPALLAVAETLERLKPGSWYRVSAELQLMLRNGKGDKRTDPF